MKKQGPRLKDIPILDGSLLGDAYTEPCTKEFKEHLDITLEFDRKEMEEEKNNPNYPDLFDFLTDQNQKLTDFDDGYGDINDNDPSEDWKRGDGDDIPF